MLIKNLGMRKILIISLLFSWQLQAQEANSASNIKVSLVFANTAYEEPDVMTEKGGNGGVEAELGYGFSPTFGVSLFGAYWDGRLHYEGSTFGGTPVETITADFVSDTRLYLNTKLSSLQISLGYGRRFWYNDLVISYRRRTEYKFVPLKITFTSGSLYYAVEYDHWLEGLNKSHMADVGGGRSDVELPQKTGMGYGLEVGWILAPMAQAFIRVHKWMVDPSETAFDGVDTLVEPENNTLTTTVGMGLVF